MGGLIKKLWRFIAADRSAAEAVLDLLTLEAGVCFIVLAVLRAVRVSLTYDEAAGYLKYVATDPLSIFNFAYATNHFLNTALVRAITAVGGGSELMLRLPSLIGYGLYLVFALLILRALSQRVIALVGFLLLNLNPYVTEYFSLSRGYGLSLGLLMGALFFLLRFLAQLPAEETALVSLSRALLLAAAAVMANFSLLNVYLAIVALAGLSLVVTNRSTSSSHVTSATAHRPFSRARKMTWLLAVAAAWSMLVLSQDIGLSRELYEPVVVSFAGLNESELAAVAVVRSDFRGRETLLSRHADGWRRDSPEDFAGLRVELPASITNRQPTIEVSVGKRAFLDDRRASIWNRRDVGTTRVFESNGALSLPKSSLSAFQSVINWGGDRRHFRYLLGSTAGAVAALGLFAAVLAVLGALGVRSRWLTAGQWQPLESSVLWLAALVGPPVYLLNRDAQLYFGGNEGIVQDTFYSLIEDSFHGQLYHAGQVSLMFDAIVATLALCGVVSVLLYRRSRPRRLPAAAAVLALMIIVSLAEVAQHDLLSTPFLVGRTALLFFPLYVLFAVFSFDGLAALGRVGKTCAMCVLAPVLSVALYHFAASFNLEYAWDWPRDAATKTMIDDLGQIVRREHQGSPKAVLEVYWWYWPVAAFYVRRSQAAGIDVVIEPSTNGSDFRYDREEELRNAAGVVKQYPVAGSTLVRTAP